MNGPEGGDLPLVLLKRKVKKLIEEEDERKPLTDDQLAAELQSHRTASAISSGRPIRPIGT